MKITFEQLVEWNNAYRTGESIISDQQFDDALESYINDNNLAEVDVRSRLMDIPGKVKHEFMCGSLKKLKAEDEDGEFDKWWNNQNSNTLEVSAKVDGMSIVAKFEDGVLISATTRGDGTYGENQTEKCRYIMPTNTKFTGTVRGELTLTDFTFERLQEIDDTREHKNLRNSTVGIINQKTLRPDLCELVKFIAYEIVGSELPRAQQIFTLANTYGFKVPRYTQIANPTIEKLVEHYQDFVDTSNYMVDGLVMHGLEWVAENDKYYPTGARAFKVNDEREEVTVTSIKWNLGKSGKLTPVVQFDPVELCGTSVKQATGHNASNIIEKGIGPAAKILIQKSGDIIPFIVEVILPVETDDQVKCPHCGHVTEWDENKTHLICNSGDCSLLVTKKMESFIRKLGVTNATGTSLTNWGIYDWKTLINFTAKKGSKSQANFNKQIKTKVLSKDKKDLVGALTWDGAGRKTFVKLFDHFGSFEKLNDIMINPPKTIPLPEGIGIITMLNIKADWVENMKIVDAITSHDEYEVVVAKPKKTCVMVSNNLNGKHICITGKTKLPRKQLQEIAKENGGLIKGISNSLDILVAGEKAGPSKLAKCKSLGISIITEDEFLAMI